MDPALPSPAPAPRAMMSHNLVGGWHENEGAKGRLDDCTTTRERIGDGANQKNEGIKE